MYELGTLSLTRPLQRFVRPHHDHFLEVGSGETLPSMISALLTRHSVQMSCLPCPVSAISCAVFPQKAQKMTAPEFGVRESFDPVGTAASVAIPVATQLSQMKTPPGPATRRATLSRDVLQKEQPTCDGADMRSNG